MNLKLYTAGLHLINFSVIYFIFIGTLVGIIIGALPGLTAMMAVSILVPLTYGLSPTAGIMMLLGVYCGANYGGSISATLVNIPGTPSAVVTTLDAYPLAKKGKAGLAIGIATMTSAIGGILSVFALAIFTPLIAGIALKFTSLEMLSIAVFGISVIAYISPGSSIKGLIAGIIGLLIGTIGYDPVTSTQRFTFGQVHLLGGVQFIAAMIGLFGLSEILLSAEKGRKSEEAPILHTVTNPFECFKYLKQLIPTIMRSSLVGVIIGAIPGAGGTIASIVSYAGEKKISKNPHELGQGSLEGIAAAEASNNACTGGAMTTMLALGIPGDAVTAILIGAFILHGLTPGPMLYRTNFDFVSAIFIGMLIINVLILVLGLLGAKYFAKLLLIPKPILNTTIMALCIIGTYGVQNNIFDVVTMLVFAAIGYIMTKAEIPRAPIVLALILGPIMEENLRRWITLSDGNYVQSLMKSFASNPISLIIFSVTIITLLLPLFQKNGGINEGMAKQMAEESKLKE